MILCFDIGNTNIVVGLVDDKKIVATYRFVTDSSLTEDDYYLKISPAVKGDISGAIISCVVPALDKVIERMLNKYFHVKPIFVGPGIKSGIKLKIANPKELGSDLLCDAVGAASIVGYPSVIVDLGTATKFIVVNEKKEYLGGAIAPGMKGSLMSLIASAAKLNQTPLDKPESVIGNDTVTCIQSGMVFGMAAMIDGMVGRIKEELGIDNINVILTGGLSVLVKDIIKTKVIYEPNVLLYGLIQIYYKNI